MLTWTWRNLEAVIFTARLVYFLYSCQHVGKRMDKRSAIAAAIFAAQLVCFLYSCRHVWIWKRMDQRTAIAAAIFAARLVYFLSRIFGTR